MTTEELKLIIEKVIHQKMEFQTIEIKAAHEGSPKRLYDSLSSFSNQDDGGVILFGIDEQSGFKKVGVHDPKALQDKIVEQCNEMVPKIRPLVTVYEEDGLFFVSAEIPPTDIIERPCYYAGKGRMKGSYVRVGQSDEPMTEYEVFSYEAYRKKYQEDIRPIERAQLSSLGQNEVNSYLSLLRENKPNLARLEDQQIMTLMSILVDGHPTLSSLLLFCPYPQAFFPQLSIIATSIPGLEMGVVGQDQERFIDNKRIEGSLAEMLAGTLSFVKNNMRTSTSIDPETGTRKDVPDYPVAALREVVLNALVHRDYSMHTEGMPIQILMFTDRIEIKNPGGLYGRISIDQLGKVQPDTRNPVLATAMEVLGLTENRYSGIPTIRSAMHEAGNPEPIFEEYRGTFTVTLRKRNSAKTTEFLLSKELSREDRSMLEICMEPRTRTELANNFQYKSISYFIKTIINPYIDRGLLSMTNPDHPKSPSQKYVTSEKYRHIILQIKEKTIEGE